MNIGEMLKNLPPILDDFEFYDPERSKSESVFNIPSLELEDSTFAETFEETEELEQFQSETVHSLPSLDSKDLMWEETLEKIEDLNAADFLADQDFSQVCQTNASNNMNRCRVLDCNFQFESTEEYSLHFDFEHKYVPCLKQGCNVNMTLRHMPEHLNSSHPNDFQECTYCEKYVLRKN